MAKKACGLTLFSQSILSPPADAPQKVAACPTADLTASVCTANDVLVRRRGGEVVYKLTDRVKTVQTIAWKSNGQYIAVAWSDGVVRLAGLESPKALHQIRLFDRAPKAITYIAWACNLAGSSEVWQLTSSSSTLPSTELNAVLDLPQAIACIDAEESLIKLPTLPVTGGSGDDMFVFSTQTSLDAMFRPLDARDNDAVHIMVLATADGAIHVSIYDTLVMGTFNVSMPGDDTKRLHLARHASHRASSTHMLLLANADADADAVVLAPMDFTFVYESPFNLAILAHKTTTLHMLVRYIQQTIVHMQGEWQTLRELPARFFASIQDDLQKEPRSKTIVHAFRAAVLAGEVSPTFKQWLTDTVAERGHKRWHKTVAGSLQNLINLVHDSLIPALQRAAIALGRLKGLAEFHACDGIGFTVGQLEPLSELVDSLLLVATTALAQVSDELGLFIAFSAWLQTLITSLAHPEQADGEDDNAPIISPAPVLDYVGHHMVTTPLEHIFGKTPDAEASDDWKAVEAYFGSRAGPSYPPATGDVAWESLESKLHDELTKALSIDHDPDFLGILQDGLASHTVDGDKDGGKEAGDKGKGKEAGDKGKGRRTGLSPLGSEVPLHVRGPQEPPVYMKLLPKFDFLAKMFSKCADRVLKDIAQSGQQNVSFGPLTRLSVGRPVAMSDVAMVAVPKPDPVDSADVLAYTALTVEGEPGTVYLFRSSVETCDGTSTDVVSWACTLALGDTGGDTGGVVAFQFAGTDLLLILLAATKDRNARLVTVALQSPLITYAEYRDGMDITSLPTHRLTTETLGLQPSSLCWVADVEPPVYANDAERGRGPAAAKGKSSPIAHMQVLVRPSEKGTSPAGPRSRDSTVRVAFVHADSTTYRVFSLPSMRDMFT